jgi:hypothetical protein
MEWKTEYILMEDNIKVEGYSISEDDCLSYFAERVSSKIAESDGADQLKACITDMARTGFNTDGLLLQIKTTPQVKDWEVGEAFAETVLEDRHEAMFPWETSWDKRVESANLPGPDLVGFQDKKEPRFAFGETKSSSEQRVPPQNVNANSDCLREQMKRLRHMPSVRSQLLQWLLLHIKETDWEPVFKEALQCYSERRYWLTGVLVSGGRTSTKKDLTSICADIGHSSDEGEVTLFAYYLPFTKDKWPELLVGNEGVA